MDTSERHSGECMNGPAKGTIMGFTTPAPDTIVIPREILRDRGIPGDELTYRIAEEDPRNGHSEYYLVE